MAGNLCSSCPASYKDAQAVERRSGSHESHRGSRPGAQGPNSTATTAPISTAITAPRLHSLVLVLIYVNSALQQNSVGGVRIAAEVVEIALREGPGVAIAAWAEES